MGANLMKPDEICYAYMYSAGNAGRREALSQEVR